MKVKVSKEVSLILGNARKYAEDNLVSFMNIVHINIRANSKLSNENWLKENNLTDDDLINAYKYGWEEEYEFQVGDIVKGVRSEFVQELTVLNIKEIKNSQFKFVIVCKKENREDLKNDK